MGDALDSLLRPSSVAVVGASDEPFVFSGAPLHNLRAHGFTGAIYAVNPRRTTVQGLPCHPSILDVPGDVDTVVITVPAAAAVEVLAQCEQRGVRSATVVSTGFGEEGAGPAGLRNAARLRAFVEQARIRLLGPNTAGLINLLDGYVPRAAVNHLAPQDLRTGPVALITQSGACSNILFNRAQAHGVGIGLMAATGDEEDITVWELVRHVLADERISVVMVVTESVGDPELIRAAARESRRLAKPIVHLRLGSSELGSAVVLTHSGSIAGDAVVAREAFRQWGIVEVDDFDQLWQTARLFEVWGAPSGSTSSTGVFAFSGGEAALVADHASRFGLELPAPPPAFEACVADNLAYAKAANPFDATGELVGRPDKLAPVLRGFLDDGGYTEVLVATPVYRAEAANRVLPQLRDLLPAGRRVVLSMWPAGGFTAEQQRLLEATGAPVLPGSTAAVAAIRRYQQYREPVRIPEPESAPVAEVAGCTPLPETYLEVRTLLQESGLPFGPARSVRSGAEAIAATTAFPVVAKANVPSTVHKAAAGLVRVGIGSPAELSRAVDELAAHGRGAGGDGSVVVEATAAGSLQLIVGARRDPIFGVVLLAGLGGSAADFLDDTAVVLAEQIDDQLLADLLSRTAVGRFLRRSAPVAAKEVARIADRLFALLHADPRIAEIDLNPVLVDTGTSRVTCVDGRLAAGGA